MSLIYPAVAINSPCTDLFDELFLKIVCKMNSLYYIKSIGMHVKNNNRYTHNNLSRAIDTIARDGR
jgi:hypothetical protein